MGVMNWDARSLEYSSRDILEMEGYAGFMQERVSLYFSATCV